jgi:hypothetical protein
MFDRLPPEIQVYLFSLGVGLSAPLLVYWMLRGVLGHFLQAIFRNRDIERFWMRVVLLVLLAGALSKAVTYKASSDVLSDYVAIIFSLSDQVQAILESLLWTMLALFLPLLLSYTILHVGRDKSRTASDESERDAEQSAGGEADRWSRLEGRFTARARKIIQLADQEAHRWNHEYIGTEHVLLGLIREDSGVAANVLKNLDVDLQKVRIETEKLIQSGPEKVHLGNLPRTPRVKQVLRYAIEEAAELKHDYVGTEHILLGLLREEEGVAAHVLMNLGLKLADVRAEVLNILGRSSPGPT